MEFKLFLLLGMLFLHLVDDYYLQGWLASAKQKSWWKKNSPDKLYSHDYIMALCEHAFSWTFMIMLIPAVFNYVCSHNSYFLSRIGLLIVLLIISKQIKNILI